MILPDKYYQVIKWTVLTVLPAASVLVATLGKSVWMEWNRYDSSDYQCSSNIFRRYHWCVGL